MCHDSLFAPVTLLCGHSVCKAPCLSALLSAAAPCPQCRKQLPHLPANEFAVSVELHEALSLVSRQAHRIAQLESIEAAALALRLSLRMADQAFAAATEGSPNNSAPPAATTVGTLGLSAGTPLLHDQPAAPVAAAPHAPAASVVAPVARPVARSSPPPPPAVETGQRGAPSPPSDASQWAVVAPRSTRVLRNEERPPTPSAAPSAASAQSPTRATTPAAAPAPARSSSVGGAAIVPLDSLVGRRFTGRVLAVILGQRAHGFIGVEIDQAQDLFNFASMHFPESLRSRNRRGHDTSFATVTFQLADLIAVSGETDEVQQRALRESQGRVARFTVGKFVGPDGRERPVATSVTVAGDAAHVADA